jgi:integrase
MLDVPRPRDKYLQKETTRHGVTVWYVRVGKSPRIRLRSPFGSKEFKVEYEAAIAGQRVEDPKAVAQSVKWLIDQYKKSSDWSGLAITTRAARDNIFSVIIEASGDMAFSSIGPKSIMAGRDRRRDTPHAANNFLKTMRGLFGWAKVAGHVTRDPTEGVTQLAGDNEDGFHTWTDDEVEAFEEKWPIGTRQRLALDIFLYTGLRRGDAVQLGKQHLRDGTLTIKTEKTGEVVAIPLLQPLLQSIQATRTGDLTFLVTEYGKPFAKAGFGNWFREACDKAGVPGSAHGLRKAGAARAAENGATEADLNAIFGWREGSRESATYVRKANRKKIAARSADKLLKDGGERKVIRYSRTQAKGAGKTSKS